MWFHMNLGAYRVDSGQTIRPALTTARAISPISDTFGVSFAKMSACNQGKPADAADIGRADVWVAADGSAKTGACMRAGKMSSMISATS